MHLLLHPVVQALMDHGIPFRVEDQKVVVEGFSKSGEARLSMEQGGEVLIAETRYNQRNEIKTFEDLVGLAWEWYDGYKGSLSWSEPSDMWLPHFIKLGHMEDTDA